MNNPTKEQIDEALATLRAALARPKPLLTREWCTLRSGVAQVRHYDGLLNIRSHKYTQEVAMLTPEEVRALIPILQEYLGEDQS